ncbi:hypothetical protein N2599_20690 (plasmid) [Rhizobium sullae]|uniref:Uncharacterized protein n=1 Tax=Rhizobium sullae TaxID=50338 RepID=A0A2N0DF62_RHISU|nr:hypothetical protein [Rhizobium sullae]PKA44731.1 hypothetical protein CWR43_02460 [Rhizobium sullae]UWU17756.1 hypothetical protein N2599_20690 [Rhizobium sullae]
MMNNGKGRVVSQDDGTVAAAADAVNDRKARRAARCGKDHRPQSLEAKFDNEGIRQPLESL